MLKCAFGSAVALSSCVALDGNLVAASEGGILPFGKPIRDAYFQFEPGTIYFNHGGYGATPRPVRIAKDRYTDILESQPTKWFGKNKSTGKLGYQTWLEPVRDRLAKLIGANKSDVVFLDNASAGMNAVLRSLNWQTGDIVFLIGSLYAVFPYTAAWLEKQYGIRVIKVPISYPVSGAQSYVAPVQQALGGLSPADRAKIRLTLIDHISSYPTVILPVVQLCELVREETNGKSYIFIDGAHAVGSIAVDVATLHAAGAHFYVGDGHKWLFSPHGSGLLWVAPEAQSFMQPDVISSENPPGTPFQSRFDYIGTRDYGPWLAMADALDFRERQLGGESCIYDHLRELGHWAVKHLSERWQTEAVAPISMSAGLITMRLPIPLDWPLEAQRACASNIGTALRDMYGMQIIPFTLPLPNETQVARISMQVYLEKSDVAALASNTLSIPCTAEAASGVEALVQI